MAINTTQIFADSSVFARSLSQILLYCENKLFLSEIKTYNIKLPFAFPVPDTR